MPKKNSIHHTDKMLDISNHPAAEDCLLGDGDGNVRNAFVKQKTI